MFKKIALSIFFVLILLGAAGGKKTLPDFSGDRMVLVDNGKAMATIVIAAKAREVEIKAARELQHFIERISGARLPLADDDDEIDGTIVSVGRSKVQAQSGIDVSNAFYPERESVWIKTVGKALIIVGNDAPESAGAYQGTLFAVYTFLEGLGCSWFMPGDLGEVVPPRKTIAIGEIDYRQKASFLFRKALDKAFCYGDYYAGHQYPPWMGREYDQWMDRNLQGGIPFNVGHSFHTVIKSEWFAEHPEYFAMIDGKRTAYQRGHDGQICMSNPDVIEFFARKILKFFDDSPRQITHSLSSNDGHNWCQCKNCLAQGATLMDRYVKFMNAVAQRVEKNHPDKLLPFYVYADLTDVPQKVKPHRMLFPVIAHYKNSDHAHPMTGETESARFYRNIIEGWSKLSGRVGIQEYFGDYCYCQFPKPIVYVIRENIPYWHSVGADTIYSFGGESWGSNGIVWYIAAKLMWDHTLDVDWLLEDYFTRMYAKAAVPMRQYFDILENAMANIKGSEGLGSENVPHTFTPVLPQLETYIKRAGGLAVSDIVKRRIAFTAKNLQFAKNYLAMRNSHTAYLAKPTEQNYLLAKKAMTSHVDYINELGYCYVINKAAYFNTYVPEVELKTLARIREALREEVKSTTHIITLPEFWLFRKDVDNTGRTNGWQAIDFDDTSWEKISILNFWEPQIGTYDGFAWYRTSVELPELPVNKKIYIRFEAIDESEWVYVNGKEVGSLIYDAEKNPISWREPVSFEITDVVKSNQVNVIAVKVQDVDGAGGIWKGASIVAK